MKAMIASVGFGPDAKVFACFSDKPEDLHRMMDKLGYEEGTYEINTGWIGKSRITDNIAELESDIFVAARRAEANNPQFQMLLYSDKTYNKDRLEARFVITRKPHESKENGKS